MTTKIALVGIGKIARDQHVPTLESSSDWTLAATVSNHNRIDGVDAYTDFEDFLKTRTDIRVVSLCMPPVPRFDYAAAALRAGRHVMLEKPPGATLAECYALRDLAMEAGVSIFATWHSREAAGVAVAKAWLANKPLKSLSIIWKEDVRYWHPGQDWIWQAGGMGVFDPGINALSIMTEILPVPVHLRAATLHIPENCETPVAATLSFSHPDGASVTGDFDFLQEGEQTWTIEAETDQGTLTLSQGGAMVSIDGEAQITNSDDALNGEYPRLYAKMAALIEQGGIDMDLSPMVHVADAFTLGQRIIVDAYHE